jgi:hypothetical protein
LHRTGANFTYFERDRPTAPGGILSHGPILHGQGLLIAGGHAGIQADAKHFRVLSSLAKNPGGFDVLGGSLFRDY